MKVENGSRKEFSNVGKLSLAILRRARGMEVDDDEEEGIDRCSPEEGAEEGGW